jgi:tRNA1(Val) A37 N6-methylase TrmN6
MFCYFIQKKGFLDWNINYLREKLIECKKHEGENNFYGFYRSFLLELFHDELGKPEDKRKHTSLVPFGTIPYLNGGLFDVHEIESAYKNISIEDEAFQKIFDFFDEYNWHLDTRIAASGKDINPDVIGYIFEKYINQKEMGAYYTKEDITDYIGKNTIIPFLLDKVKSYYDAPFNPGAGFWQYLQDSGDEYIYDSVKKGGEGKQTITELDIPENIKIGIDTSSPNLIERRKDWNSPTLEEFALPTEIWRETIARLERYFELKQKIKKGEINEINDLITYNLNIRRLVQDYLEQTADSKFVRTFYKTLTEVSILDPTCGSGAFLFAALNILEPLYEVCIQRMEEFYAANPKGNKDFEDRLAPIKSGDHPNLSYYIYKTIILHNLYGVDLMKEAVEIAKLRLFLKLVAEVDPSRRKKNYGLEPLPDIDFNVRSGNTLVGFATKTEVDKAFSGEFAFNKGELDAIYTSCETLAGEFKHFQDVQLSEGADGYSSKKIKVVVQQHLNELREKLNGYMALVYGIDPKNKSAYANWLATHRPFHWFAEFYRIIALNGGFDVVIGNPPYVEYSKVKGTYTIKGYETESCGNLYAFVMERAVTLLQKNGNNSMIVPHSAICTDRMAGFIKLLDNKSTWLSSYDIRPSKLFDSVDQRLLIYILSKSGNNRFVSKYYRWQSECREYLFNNLVYIQLAKNIIEDSIAKIHLPIEKHILNKLICSEKLHGQLSQVKTKNVVYYHNAPRYHIRALNFIPYFWNEKDGEKISVQLKSLYLDDKEKCPLIVTVLSSSLFYWWFIIFSDCRHLNSREIEEFSFTLNQVKKDICSQLETLVSAYKKDIKKNAIRKECFYKATGKVIYDEFHLSKSQSIIDEIDRVLAKHYGFSEEELDFIINYDIKYRMGGELEGEDGKLEGEEWKKINQIAK